MTHKIDATLLHSATVIILALLTSACSEKPSHQEVNVKNQHVDTMITKAPDSGATDRDTKIIGAFIQNAGVGSLSFQQGAQLALRAAADPAFELKFFTAEQNLSPEMSDLKNLGLGTQTPALLWWSTEALSGVASPLSNSDVVNIAVGEVNKKQARLGASNFGFGYSNELTFKHLAKFAGNTLKSYRFAVITSQEPRYEMQSDVLIEESKSLGNTIVFQEKVIPDNNLFDSFIARAGKENCDTIFAALPAPALVKLVAAIRASKYKGKILLGDSIFAEDLKALGTDAEGVYMVQAWSEDTDLRSLYTSTYGNNPDSVILGFTALGYDTVKCLLAVNKPFDAATIKYSFLATPCEGLTGKTQFSGERIAQRRKKILTVKDGHFALAE